MGPQMSAPGPGNQADAMNKIMLAVNILKQAGMGLLPGDKLHAEVYKTIERLSKHLGGAGTMGPAAGMQKTMLGDQLRDTIKNQLLARIMGQQGGGAPGGSPPMPSTPLPGT